MDGLIISLDKWDSPAVYYPRKKLGKAKIENHFLTKGFYRANGQRPLGDTNRYAFYEATKRLKSTALTIDGKTWMVDDPPHWWTIQEYATQYYGHVLVAGLGLGLIVHALSSNPKVTDITVVERSNHVISLVGPLVPKCNIVCEDWNEYTADFKPDGVFYDLFVGDGRSLIGEAVNEMLRLRGKYPGVHHRILGFPNDVIVGMAESLERFNTLVGLNKFLEKSCNFPVTPRTKL